MLATSKNVLLPGHNHLLTTGSLLMTRHFDYQYWWLWPGNRTCIELASMVVTWWIVIFLRSPRLHCAPNDHHSTGALPKCRHHCEVMWRTWSCDSSWTVSYNGMLIESFRNETKTFTHHVFLLPEIGSDDYAALLELTTRLVKWHWMSLLRPGVIK